MLKMVLVDDEERVRRGITISADWETQGIEIVGEAGDGVEALMLIEELHPDIIITDIRMPEIDGLELTKKAVEMLPHVKVIILSGYEDFNYAQSAIRNGAFDYLLKPVKIEELVENVKKAGAAVINELSKIKDEEELRRKLRESLPILKERYLGYLFSGRVTLEDIKRRYSFVDFNLGIGNYMAAVIRVDDFMAESCRIQEEDRQLLIFAVHNIAKELIDYEFGGEIFEALPNHLTFIVNYNDKLDENENIRKMEVLCKKIKDYVNEYYNLSLTIGIGSMCQNSEFISKTCNEALNALEYSMFKEKGSTVFYRDIAYGHEKNMLRYPVENEEKVFLALKIGDEYKTKQYLEEFIQKLAGNQAFSPKQFRSGCLQFVYALMRKLQEWNINYSNEESQAYDIQLKNQRTVDDIRSWLVALTKRILDIIAEERIQRNASVISKALEFIQSNYMNGISLQDIADHVKLTSNYFSSFFKEQVGQNVLDYLTDTRMVKAKQYLRQTNLRINEIADKLGYSDSNYFGQVFRKNTGMSPNEFRQKGVTQ